MFSKKFGLLLAIVIIAIIVLVLSVYLRSMPTRFISYSQTLKAELNSINSYSGNFTFYYKGNFTSNQPLSNSLIDLPFSMPFNYTIYRNGGSNSTAFSVYYNMGRFFTLQNLVNNATVINAIREYADNGTVAAYNLSKLNYLVNKYGLSEPLAKIAFTNASGLYICSAYPNANKNSTLGIFSCGLVSNFTSAGLKYIIYNLSQISAHAVGFDMNQMNMSVQYMGNSSFLNQTCSEYHLFSTIKSYVITNIYANLSANVNGTECISTRFDLPLYQYINVTIPSNNVYAFFNLTLEKLVDNVSNDITVFPKNHALNLTYGSIS